MRALLTAALASSALLAAGCGTPAPGPTVPAEAAAGEPEPELAVLGGPGVPESRRVKVLAPGVTHTWIRRGGAGAGPWSIHVLEVDPRAFAGRVQVALATGAVTERGLMSELAREAGALAAVNAGYFVMEPADGTPGDPAGILVLDGELVSENVTGRSSLVLSPGGQARVARLRTSSKVTEAGGEARAIDGLNRAPGLVRNCGGIGGDRPVETPRHDVSCTDESELILYRPIFGDATPPGPGREAVIGADGSVTELRAGRGGPIPAGGAVLAGTGDAAAWIEAKLSRGERVELSVEVVDEAGEPLPPGASAVNGGPRLLRGGEVDIPAREEGFDFEPHYLEHFGDSRHPRTVAGITADGRLLLIVADGRQPVHSLGLSFQEAAAVARALGAVDAVNLDGGGSTALAIRGALVSRPSDDSGERPIGDAILILPARTTE